MHLKWPSYLILLENLCNFEPETGRESPDSDPRLHSLMRVHQVFGRFGSPMANSLANNFWIRPKLFAGFG